MPELMPFSLLDIDGVRGLVDDLVEHRRCGVSREGLPAAEALVEHHPHGEEVAAGIGLAGPDVLRRHVAHRAHHHARRGHVRVADLGHAEVHDLGVEAFAVPLDADVRGLDVPVDDLLPVGEPDAVANLGQNLQGLGTGEGLLLEQLLQIVPLHELHGDVEDALILAEFVDGHQVGVVQHASGTGLAGEPLLGLTTLGGRGKDGLDGHLAADRRIHPQVDFTHGAVAKDALDLEFSELLEHGDPSGFGGDGRTG